MGSSEGRNPSVDRLSPHPYPQEWRRIYLPGKSGILGLTQWGIRNYRSGCQEGKVTLRLPRGDVCPSGRLAETWPEQYEDLPNTEIFAVEDEHIQYRESTYVGYRWYDAMKKQVAILLDTGSPIQYLPTGARGVLTFPLWMVIHKLLLIIRQNVRLRYFGAPIEAKPQNHCYEKAVIVSMVMIFPTDTDRGHPFLIRLDGRIKTTSVVMCD